MLRPPLTSLLRRGQLINRYSTLSRYLMNTIRTNFYPHSLAVYPLAQSASFVMVFILRAVPRLAAGIFNFVRPMPSG
jgi:hypothetical protein